MNLKVALRTGLLTGLLAVSLSGTAEAAAMRCGTRLISEGDHAAKLLRYCGEPDVTQAHRALRPYYSITGTTYYPGLTEEIWIEEWTYNLGPNRLMRVVRLENGVVRDVRHLGYGYSKRGR